MADASKWAERIRVDLEWLKSNVHPRMSKCLRLLQPQTMFDRTDPDRERAPWARRVVRGLGSMDFLHRLPHLDAEFIGGGEENDRSNDIEDIVGLVGDRTDMITRLRQCHHTNMWSPMAWLKVGMPAIGIHQENTINETPADFFETADHMSEDMQEVPDEVVAALKLESYNIPSLEGDFSGTSVQSVLPAPRTSLDIPWVDWVDPRHVITERGIRSVDNARYIAHLIVMPKEKFMQSERYINKEKVVVYYNSNSDTENVAKSFLGGRLISTFDVSSSVANVVIAEVWVREDPDDPTFVHHVGTMDIIAGVWVEEPRPNPLKVFPWVALVASDESPGLWGPSYIEQAWDDIEDAAWNRKWLRNHVNVYHSHKLFIPDGIDFDEENWNKLRDPEYNGPVRYSGNRPIQDKSVPPQFPVSVVQYSRWVDDQFIKNTGISSTVMGSGQSSKAATAFKQEQTYMNERRNEIRYKIYELYRKAMLSVTFLMQRYLTDPIEIQRQGVKFHFDRDTMRGVINYKLNVLDVNRGDPLEDRLVELQTIERVLRNPELAAHFDQKELARMVARINHWGSRVLAPTGGPELGPMGGPAGAGPQQTPQQTPQIQGPAEPQGRTLGSRVDSGGLQGNTATAVGGAAMRAAGAGGGGV